MSSPDEVVPPDGASPPGRAGDALSPTGAAPLSTGGSRRRAALLAGTPCPYCGATLFAAYYFCVVCATPFQDVENLLPRLRPAPPTTGELIRKKAPRVWPLFWTLFCVVLGGGLIVALALGEEHVGVGIVVLDALLLGVTAVFASTHGGTLKPALLRSGFLSGAAWIALGALPVLLAVNYGYHRLIVETAGDAIADDTITVLMRSGMSHAALVFLIAVFPAISEEIAFRGLLQPWLSLAVGTKRALVLSSALFTVLHFSILSAPYLFAVGLLLGWTRARTGSLYPSILLHFLHNWAVLELFPR